MSIRVNWESDCENSSPADAASICDRGERRTEGANLLADVMLFTGAAVGITTILLTILNRRDGGSETQDSVRVAVGPTGISVEGTF